MLSGTSVGNRPEDKDDILVGCVFLVEYVECAEQKQKQSVLCISSVGPVRMVKLGENKTRLITVSTYPSLAHTAVMLLFFLIGYAKKKNRCRC